MVYIGAFLVAIIYGWVCIKVDDRSKNANEASATMTAIGFLALLAFICVVLLVGN